MDPKSRKDAPVPLPVRRAMRGVSDSVSRWRRLRGVTQAQLAERAGVSRGVVRRLEAGDGGVSVENLLRILRALGVAELMTDALDPLNSDIGRLRAEQALPERVRPRRLSGDG
ncbi:MAG TPA: helix-turn-helix domain-containing protein [Solirubrobacteraceae bacterium]|nr:helix-turn-helix domain-containing protein [Solirubrobacteraceae bacterium]